MKKRLFIYNSLMDVIFISDPSQQYLKSLRRKTLAFQNLAYGLSVSHRINRTETSFARCIGVKLKGRKAVEAPNKRFFMQLHTILMQLHSTVTFLYCTLQKSVCRKAQNSKKTMKKIFFYDVISNHITRNTKTQKCVQIV